MRNRIPLLLPGIFQASLFFGWGVVRSEQATDDEQEQIRHCGFLWLKHEVVCVQGDHDCTPIDCGAWDGQQE